MENSAALWENLMPILSKQHLQVLWLLYGEGLSQKRAAEELGCHRQTVAKAHEEAVSKLRTFANPLFYP